MQTYKFNKEGEFITDIVVALERAKLEFSPDSKFEHDGILKGKLIGTSIKYYEKDNSSLGYKEIQTNVLSIFECKLTDYEKILKDNGKGDLLEEMKEDLEHQKKKKNWCDELTHENTAALQTHQIHRVITLDLINFLGKKYSLDFGNVKKRTQMGQIIIAKA